MTKLIIFDLDGPILDSFGTTKKSVFKTSQKLKLPPPNKESFILSWGYPGKLVVKKLFPGISNQKAEVFVKFWAENEKEKKSPLVKGARSTLGRIKKTGFATALLTTRSHNLGFYFGRLELSKYFDFFQSFDDLTTAKEKVHPSHIFHPSLKNNPSFFNNLVQWIKRKNLCLAEAVFIDDTLVGLKLARKMKLPFLGVCTGPLNSKAKWQKYGNLDGKYVINSIAELPKWLEKNRRT